MHEFRMLIRDNPNIKGNFQFGEMEWYNEFENNKTLIKVEGYFFNGFALCYEINKDQMPFTMYLEYPLMEDINDTHFKTIMQEKMKNNPASLEITYFDIALSYGKQKFMAL